MEKEPVGTYLANKTRKGKLIGAMPDTKISPSQSSAVREDQCKSSWATAEALRGMVTVQAVFGLDSQGGGETHGDDDPSPGMPSGKFKLEDGLGAEAPSCYEVIVLKSWGVSEK
jgi:hypothetical protein